MKRLENKMNIHKATTITYVPNTYCNLGCKYCYLGSQTDIKTKGLDEVTDKLKEILDSYLEEGIVIEQVMLHGAEITTLPEKHLRELFSYINEYNKKYSLEIATFGTRKPAIHIKTNLFNFDKLYDLMEEFGVSISGSFDLPFKLHSKFRVDKKNRDTLPKILDNIRLLKDYKYSKGLSCVFTKEAFDMFDEWVRDIRYMHEELGFDMIENFYIMFAYDSLAAEDKFDGRVSGTSMLSQEELVILYEKLKEEFKGTEYEKAIKYNWFKEFLPGYCTFQNNCGTNNFLYQKNGDVYPCHRTQVDKSFKYGNIYKDGLKTILENGPKVIDAIENEMEIEEDCFNCEYFNYCQLNCTLVRKETKFYKSYTCSLQKAIYKDQPERYPVNKRLSDTTKDEFIRINNRKLMFRDKLEIIPDISFEMYETTDNIINIINKDKDLVKLYDHDNFSISVNGATMDLYSPIINPYVRVASIKKDDIVLLKIKKDIFTVNCEESNLPSNYFLTMCLRNTENKYGDEERTKQEHIFDETVYYKRLMDESNDIGDYVVYDISDIIHRNKHRYVDGVYNNMFFTTKYGREYHYIKHAKNAFYHIQAINLPFQNFMFFYEN